MCEYGCILVFVCIYICMHVYSCMHVCVYMHVCMYTPIDLMRALLFTSVPLNGALARTTKWHTGRNQCAHHRSSCHSFYARNTRILKRALVCRSIGAWKRGPSRRLPRNRSPGFQARGVRQYQGQPVASRRDSQISSFRHTRRG